MDAKSTLLPEKMMMSTSTMPVRNTKDKFKRALMAGKQRPREDESLTVL